MSGISSTLSQQDQKATGDALQGSLVDLIDLSLQAKQAHWNLAGSHFRSIHLQLDEVVALAREHMDVLAERAIAIGVNPDGRAKTVADNADAMQFSDGYLKDVAVVDGMVKLLAGIARRFRGRIETTEKSDRVTQDLLIAVTQELEKQHWMFQAQL